MALNAVKAAAREAGAIAMRYFKSGHEAWEKGPGQIVTAADIEIDRFLSRALPRIVDAAWLSEETEDNPARLEAERVWIVDPIDGTRSFAQGSPEFTISIALVENGLPVLGVVFNPALDEMFTAKAGGGARLDGQLLAVRDQTEIACAEIVVSQTEDRKRHFSGLFPQAHVTIIGSLAYKLAKVSAARFDAYFSWRRAHDWDIAAAALLVSEAGGKMTDAQGAAITFNNPAITRQGLIAASPALHAGLLERSLARKLSAGSASP